MRKILIGLIILLFSTFCLIKLYEKIEIINNPKKLIKELTPKFHGQDTLDLLKLCLSLKEFDDDTKLLDTSKRITILMYPYITGEYTLYKYNKKVWVANCSSHPYNNEFIFDSFRLYSGDSANIFFIFNDFHVGRSRTKKIKSKWIINNYTISRM